MLHQWFLESHKGLQKLQDSRLQTYLAHAFSCFTLMTLLLACSPLLDCLQMTLCYLTIKNDQDAQSLQHNLDLLCEWEARWLMEFHPDKCEVSSVARKKHPTLHLYYIHGHQHLQAATHDQTSRHGQISHHGHELEQ